MSAKDSLHFQVRRALVKDGWTITDDPFLIEYKDVLLKADLGAEKFLRRREMSVKLLLK